MRTKRFVAKDRASGRFYKTLGRYRRNYTLVDNIMDATIFKSISGIKKALGRSIENRDWIERRKGPFSHMSLPEDIEIMEIKIHMGPEAAG